MEVNYGGKIDVGFYRIFLFIGYHIGNIGHTV